MKAFKFAVWAGFTIIVLVFFVALIGQNAEPMSFTLFMHTSSDYPKWAVLIACILLGGFLASLFFVVELVILETKNIRLRRANKKLERILRSVDPSQANALLAANGSLTNPSINPNLAPGATPLVSGMGPNIGSTGLGSLGQISPSLEEDV